MGSVCRPGGPCARLMRWPLVRLQSKEHVILCGMLLHVIHATCKRMALHPNPSHHHASCREHCVLPGLHAHRADAVWQARQVLGHVQRAGWVGGLKSACAFGWVGAWVVSNG